MASTHFGYESVDEADKARRVRGVFDSVASKYDLMNDLMSGGLHRLWKAYAVMVANVQPVQRVLDIAGGTGDLARSFAKKGGDGGEVVRTDNNDAMLPSVCDRLVDARAALPTAAQYPHAPPFAPRHSAPARLPSPPRNMTHKDRALREMARVLKPGGRLLVLEFSQVAPPLRKLYDLYSFNVLPRLGKLVTGDEASYRYLAESIRMHPAQEELKSLMKECGFGHVDYHNMTGGVVALHVGVKCE